MNIHIEVTFADERNQLTIPLSLPATCSIKEAILRSNILIRFPHIDLTQNKVGIFGKLCPLTTLVQSGDRIEIYRALSTDPKKNRRNRAKKQKLTLSH
jgi:uncharacterized protein